MVDMEIRGSHPSQEREGPWISCHAASDRIACAAFIKESRMHLANATNLDRKSGRMGHPGFWTLPCGADGLRMAEDGWCCRQDLTLIEGAAGKYKRAEFVLVRPFRSLVF
jgi:hypothetical protein